MNWLPRWYNWLQSFKQVRAITRALQYKEHDYGSLQGAETFPDPERR